MGSPTYLHKSPAGCSLAEDGDAGAYGAQAAGSEIRPYLRETLGAGAAGAGIWAYRRAVG